MSAMTTSAAFEARALIRTVAVLAAMGIGAGCSTYRPTFSDPSRDAAVSVEFRRPTTIAMLSATGDTIQVAGVTALHGRVDWVTPDTVYLRLSGVVRGSGYMGAVQRGALIAVARRPDVLIQQREMHTGRTVALLLASAVAIATLGLAALAATFSPV